MPESINIQNDIWYKLNSNKKTHKSKKACVKKKQILKPRSIRSDNSHKKRNAGGITIPYLKICSQPWQRSRSIASTAATTRKAQMQTDKQEQKHRSQCNRIKDQGRRICLKNNISFSKWCWANLTHPIQNNEVRFLSFSPYKDPSKIGEDLNLKYTTF